MLDGEEKGRDNREVITDETRGPHLQANKSTLVHFLEDGEQWCCRIAEAYIATSQRHMTGVLEV